MEPVLSSEEMRQTDNYTIKELGLSGEILMENAGKSCAEVMMRNFSEMPDPSILVLSGSGNNGGDGFVVARYLQLAGYEVEVWTLADGKKLKGNAAFHFQITQKFGVPINKIEQTADIPIENFHIVVDALLGTGAEGAPRGIIKEIITLINESELLVVSIDVASGLNGNSGKVAGEVVDADYTIAIENYKIPHIVNPAKKHNGMIDLINIGLSPQGIETNAAHLFTANDVAFKEFEADTHKYKRGELLLIGGSEKMTGAIYWAARGSMISGAGYTTIAVPTSAHAAIKTLEPAAVTFSLSEQNGYLNVDAAIDSVLNHLKKTKAVLVGNGLGRGEDKLEFVSKLLEKLPPELPVVVDADAILAVDISNKKIQNHHLILTPHSGELQYLLGKSVDLNSDENVLWRALQKELPEKWILNAKGSPSVAISQHAVILNSSGGPELAIAGSGDLLAGYLAGLCAYQDEDLFYNVCLANLIHGAAGQYASEEQGEFGVTMYALADALPMVIKEYTG